MATEFESGQEDQELQWYTLKVQVNREDHVQRELTRRVERYGLGKYIEQILVPVEHFAEIKNGRKRELKRKMFPGYLLVRMILNEETWFLMRETPGVGDFTGASGRPLPMSQADIDKFLKLSTQEKESQPKLEIPFQIGESVKIIEGAFIDNVGEVSAVDVLAGRVTVNVQVMRGSKPVEMVLEYWQIEKVEA